MNFLKVITVLIFIVGMTSCVKREEGVKYIRVAYVMAPGGTVHEGALRFASLVEEKSGGKIKVQLYPNGMLGNERTIAEGVALRSVDMIISGPAIIGWYAPEYAVVEAPFVFRDYEHLETVMRGEIGKEIEKSIHEKSGLHFMAFFHRGPRYLTTTSKPVISPDDLKGLKLRVPELPTYLKSWETFGANPTPINFSDVFMALKLGVVDGQENPLEIIYTSHFYETQDYVMETKHLLSFYIVSAGDYFYKKFNKKEQQLIVGSMTEAEVFHNNLVAEFEEDYKKKIKEYGVQFIQVDREAFEKLAVEKLPPLFKDSWKPGIYERISNIKATDEAKSSDNR